MLCTANQIVCFCLNSSFLTLYMLSRILRTVPIAICIEVTEFSLSIERCTVIFINLDVFGTSWFYLFDIHVLFCFKNSIPHKKLTIGVWLVFFFRLVHSAWSTVHCWVSSVTKILVQVNVSAFKVLSTNCLAAWIYFIGFFLRCTYFLASF